MSAEHPVEQPIDYSVFEGLGEAGMSARDFFTVVNNRPLYDRFELLDVEGRKQVVDLFSLQSMKRNFEDAADRMSLAIAQIEKQGRFRKSAAA